MDKNPPLSKCKFCGELAEDCGCKRLRLLLCKSVADANGCLAERRYKTQVVIVPLGDSEYEIIGGEWLGNNKKGDGNK